MYVCMYVSMYVCIYVCMYLCIYVSMYLCMYVSMYVCMNVLCMHIACMYINTDTYLGTCQTSMTELFSQKSFIIDVELGPKQVS